MVIIPRSAATRQPNRFLDGWFILTLGILRCPRIIQPARIFVRTLPCHPNFEAQPG
jgi:hypothetical protein